MLKSDNLPKINFLTSDREPIEKKFSTKNILLANKPSTSSIKHFERKDKKVEMNFPNENKEILKVDGLPETNSEMLTQQKFEGKKFSSKVFTIRKHFSSEDKGKLRQRQNE